MEISRETVPSFPLDRSVPASPEIRGHRTTLHSAPSSPTTVHKSAAAADDDDGGSGSNSDEFEFETSRRFNNNYIELEIGQDFEWFVEELPKQQQLAGGGVKQKRERGGSLPAMAFADELFYNGLVMPLKPPPAAGLQYSNDEEGATFCHGPFPASPRSVFKVPFVHRAAAWNDEFDPFKVALEKVSEESFRKSQHDHRRTKSHSPFLMKDDEQILGSKFGLPQEPKGSPYARFVIDQNKQVEKISRSSKKVGSSKKEKNHEGNSNVFAAENGMKKMRSILMKYTSFGRDNDKARNRNPRKNWKSNFRKFSFKVKGQGKGSDHQNENEKKRGIEEEVKMQVIEYKRSKSSFAFCSHGFETHENIL